MSEAEWSLEWSRQQSIILDLFWCDHLQILVKLCRQFYLDYAHSPNTRVLIKYFQSHYDVDCNSIQLQLLLKGNPAVVLARLAGIPKPKQCF